MTKMKDQSEMNYSKHSYFFLESILLIRCIFKEDVIHL